MKIYYPEKIYPAFALSMAFILFRAGAWIDGLVWVLLALTYLRSEEA